MSEFYVVAVCHTNRGHEYVTLWRPDDCGYTPALPRAGKYDYERVMSHMDYYNGGEHIAIRAHALEAIAEPIPDGFFDYAGPGIANRKENWEAIKAAIAWPTKYPVRPDWYGKRGRRPA